MATFVNNSETISKYETVIANSLTTLKSLKSTYSDSISTANGHISSITFSTWQDDVQASFQIRTDQLKEEMRQIETSVSSEHFPYMISKLENLQEKLNDLKRANSEYNNWYNLKVKLQNYIEEHGSDEGFFNTLGTMYCNCTGQVIQANVNSYSRWKTEYTNEINALISTISSITFGEALPSDNTSSTGIDAITGASPTATQNSTETVTEYYDSAMGCTVQVTMTTTEVDGNIVQVRTTTYTDSDGNVIYSENFEITMNKDDPRQVKVVDEEGNVYETTVDEDGQLVNVTENTDKNGNTTTDTSAIGETYYTMTVTNNSTGETSTYTINTESPADMAIFRMLYENANMEAGTMEGHAFEGNHHFTLGGAESTTLGGLFGNPEVTVTFTPSE